AGTLKHEDCYVGELRKGYLRSGRCSNSTVYSKVNAVARGRTRELPVLWALRWCFAAMNTVEQPLLSLLLLDWTADGNCARHRQFLESMLHCPQPAPAPVRPPNANSSAVVSGLRKYDSSGVSWGRTPCLCKASATTGPTAATRVFSSAPRTRSAPPTQN